MMKNLSVYFLLGFVPSFMTACGGAKEEAATGSIDSMAVASRDTVTFTIENLGHEQYCQAAESFGYCDTSRHVNDSLVDAELLQKHASVVKRTGQKLEVTTKKGVQTFTDNDSESDDYQAFRLCQVSDRLVVIRNGYYESYDYTCVDLETGQVFRTWGQPVLNAQGNKMIAGNSDLESGFTNTGLQLYVNDSKSWQLRMQKELDDWGPEDLLWKNDTEVWCKKEIPATANDTYTYADKKSSYVKVLLKEEKID